QVAQGRIALRDGVGLRQGLGQANALLPERDPVGKLADVSKRYAEVRARHHGGVTCTDPLALQRALGKLHHRAVTVLGSSVLAGGAPEGSEIYVRRDLEAWIPDPSDRLPRPLRVGPRVRG